MKALDEIYKIYTFTLMRLLNTRAPLVSNRNTAPHSKIRLKFVKHFRMFAVVLAKLCSFFCNDGPKLTNLNYVDDIFSEFKQIVRQRSLAPKTN